MLDRSVTYVALLTPPGRGAIAALTVSGPAALAATQQLFSPAGRLSVAEAPVGRILFGRWENGEELVVTRRGPEQFEIHCHGGVAASAAIIDSLARLGCREISWREWLEFHADDPIARAAHVALASAMTERTAAVLLDQAEGALATAFAKIETMLAAGDRAIALREVDVLLSRAALGRRLTLPWRVVIAGPPNAGKSSLLNALVGYERAIAFPTPGTTRDVVTAATAIDGWPVELSDTAGLREAEDAIESAGVELAQGRLAQADLALLVFDISLPWNEENAALAAAWPGAIVVHNKLDLAPAGQASERPSGIRVSSLTGEGLEELGRTISSRLVPDPPPSGAAVPFTDEQIARLEQWLYEAETS